VEVLFEAGVLAWAVVMHNCRQHERSHHSLGGGGNGALNILIVNRNRNLLGSVSTVQNAAPSEARHIFNEARAKRMKRVKRIE